MSWRDDARAFIAKLDADIPDDATLAERKRYLNGNSWGFTGGTSWGRKIWGQEARVYYERHGQARRLKPVASDASEPDFGPDIIFPFRETAQ